MTYGREAVIDAHRWYQYNTYITTPRIIHSYKSPTIY